MGQARLTRIDAVQEMAAAVDAFRNEATAIVEGLDMEIRHALEWIHHDRHDHWNHQVRRGWERITEARVQLQQAMTARRIGEHDPACIDEKKALARAKQRLEIAQEKVEAVRHSARAIDHAVDEYRGARTPLSVWLESGGPQGPGGLAAHDGQPGGLPGPAGSRRRSAAASAEQPGGGGGGGPLTDTRETPAPWHRRQSRYQQPGKSGRRRPMRLWDLTAGAAKLELALKTLQTKTAEIGEAWSDEAYDRFLETYLEPIEPRMKTMIDAIHRLSEVLNTAERQCRDENS